MGQYDNTLIRVDKGSSFGIRKRSSKSIQYQPKLFVNNQLIPRIELGESFRYLGRCFDFNMSDERHKSELCDLFNDIVSKIDKLPLHPRNKILLYSRYLLSRISWNLTITDISKTWICETLDNVATKYIRKWLELPISATLSNVYLPQNKFGLNIILPSTKFIQCQTVSHSTLKASINEDINKLWSITGTNKNIQYDIYKNTKDVLKAFRNENEQKLQNHLISQVLSSQVSSKSPRHHSIPYGTGHPFNPDFQRIYLISLSVISTTPSLLGKTWSNGVCHRLMIVPFAPLLSHSCMSSLIVKHI
jgi:hypothetical protein